MGEMEEYVLVSSDAAYEPDEDTDDVHDQEAHFLAGTNEINVDVNHFASEPTGYAATAQCGTAEGAAPPGEESEGSADDDVEAIEEGPSLSDERSAAEEEEGVVEEPERKDGEGDHGTTWQQHTVGLIRSVGPFAAATVLAVLLGGQQQTPDRLHFASDRKAAKVSATRDARLHQGMSVPRFEHPPAIISFGGSYNYNGFKF